MIEEGKRVSSDTSEQSTSSSHQEQEQPNKTAKESPAPKGTDPKPEQDSINDNKDEGLVTPEAEGITDQAGQPEKEAKTNGKNEKSSTSDSEKNETKIRRAVVVPPDPNVKVDRYGWIIKNPVTLTEKEKELLANEEATEREREVKWAKMLSSQGWPIFSTKKHSKFKDRIKKGIPDAFRGKAWPAILYPESMNPTNSPEPIDDLIAKGTQKCCIVIEADLSRTMPQCPMFNTESAIDSLRRILHAYSNKDPELGYTQGMSFIAATFLHYMDEITAYYCFERLMLDPAHERRFFFLPGFPRLLECNKVWETILMNRFPKVARHFEETSTNPLIYTPSWFLTAFLNVDFPIIVRLRIFDRFVMYGTRALLSFACVIINSVKDTLAHSSVEKLMVVLQRPQLSPEMQDWRALLEQYDKQWITISQYEKYFKKAGVKLFP